ncbi:ammonium transporter 3 member [Musa troglodytarum]|uniref:Ammonium transporter 3 member n=1 Tax=Musa troglodytarum TaxID=320322 RepID=A0A9E7LE16_9LILI|nr:ammonium transporter 3 member [Musa troglodytarum]
MAVPTAYQGNTSAAVREWLNKGDNAWQMVSATLGLVILYGSIVKKKWAVNSAFMALYAFAAVWICWVTWAYNMSFGDKLVPFWGKAKPALGQRFLIKRAALPATTHLYHNGTVETAMSTPYLPMASVVYFQCSFAAITVVLLAGSLLGRMNIKAWMAFVPLWLTFSYTVGAFSLWGGGFLFQWGVIDYSGGYVIHLSSGIAGLTAAYWVLHPSHTNLCVSTHADHLRLAHVCVGRAEDSERQREVPAEQRVASASRGGPSVDGVGGVQRRGALRRQHRRVHGGAQHARMRCDEPPHVDDARRGLLQEAVSYRRRARDDDRPRLHHTRRR